MINSLAAGEIDRWEPDLEPAESVVQAAFPAVEPETGTFLRSPATAYRLPAAAGAPDGLVLWVEAGALSVVEIRDAVPTEAALDALGPPDATLASGLSRAAEQQVWPALGLSLHRHRPDDRVMVLYAHWAGTLAELERSPLAQIAAERRLRET